MSKLSEFTLRPALNALTAAVQAATPVSGSVVQIRMPAGSAAPAGYSPLAETTLPQLATQGKQIAPTYLPEFNPTYSVRPNLPYCFANPAYVGNASGPFGVQFLETSTHFFLLSHSGSQASGSTPLTVARFTKDWQYLETTTINSGTLASYNAFVHADNIYIPAIACSSGTWNYNHSQSYILRFNTTTLTLSTFWTQTNAGLGGNRLIHLKIGNQLYMLGHPSATNSGNTWAPDRNAYRLDLDAGTGTLLTNWLPSAVVYLSPASDTFYSLSPSYWTGQNNYNSAYPLNFFTESALSYPVTSPRFHRFTRSFELPNGVSLAINAIANYTYVSVNPQLITANASGVLSMRTLDGTDLPRPDASLVATVPWLSGIFMDFETSTLIVPYGPNTSTTQERLCYFGYNISSAGVITYIGPIAVPESFAKGFFPFQQYQQPATYPAPLGAMLSFITTNATRSGNLFSMRFATSGTTTPPAPTGVRYYVKN